MKLRALLLPVFAAAAAHAQTTPTQLTIYNGDFAVARTTVDLNLHAGSNEIVNTDVTRHLEPDSVILRDPTGRNAFQIGEQNYDSAVIDQQTLLRKFEGQTIDFNGGSTRGRIVRAGDNGTQPLIEVNGKLQFQLPGIPNFPPTTDGLLLKPTLKWKIEAPRPEHFSAELAYITGGLTWQSTYNLVAPAGGPATASDQVELTGWVTMSNKSGTDFPAARIKLMAGDVAKVVLSGRNVYPEDSSAFAAQAVSLGRPVTQKDFDDFHLYDLNRTVSLADGEIKQVEFLTAKDVTLKRIYQYDGSLGLNGINFYPGYFNNQSNYGLSDASTVAIRQEFKNSTANHLGIPLPAGRMRLYRRDADGQMEFVGESNIRHTPTDYTVSIVTGNAFDVKGKRTQTKFYTQNDPRFIDENFFVKLTNAKKQPVTVMVVEHLYRASNWVIRDPSVPFTQIDSHTIEFPVEVPASGDATMTYSVHYTW